MGLDQYLYAHKHMAEYEWYGETAVGEWQRTKQAAGFDLVAGGQLSPVGRSGEISVCVAYWRKSNMVHAWFVRNCSPGQKDDCSRLKVSRENLVELRRTCSDLLLDKKRERAYATLPPQDGFLFGSLEVDDLYWQDLQDTVGQLDLVLERWFPLRRKDASIDDVFFSYQASW